MRQPLAPRIAEYLKKQAKPIRRTDLQKMALNKNYSNDEFYEALRELKDTIARLVQYQDEETKVHYLFYTPETEYSKQLQACLDRGEDW
jgi:hypothetical protein